MPSLKSSAGRGGAQPTPHGSRLYPRSGVASSRSPGQTCRARMALWWQTSCPDALLEFKASWRHMCAR